MKAQWEMIQKKMCSVKTDSEIDWFKVTRENCTKCWKYEEEDCVKQESVWKKEKNELKAIQRELPKDDVLNK